MFTVKGAIIVRIVGRFKLIKSRNMIFLQCKKQNKTKQKQKNKRNKTKNKKKKKTKNKNKEQKHNKQTIKNKKREG